MRSLHFISGLPRAGSTLLAAILRQNPRFHAAMSSPLGALFEAVRGEFGGEYGTFLDEERRQALLTGLFEAYYRGSDRAVAFDTNRAWCAKLPALAKLFPEARVIACVREVPWILDSVERLLRRNAFDVSRITSGGTVYARIEGFIRSDGLVGFPWHALKEAFYGEEASRLLLLRYETLASRPAEAIDVVYDFLGEPAWRHDFERLDYAEDGFDAWLGTPGLHRVKPRVRYEERATVLPPDLFAKYAADSFWNEPKLNLRRVRIV